MFRCRKLIALLIAFCCTFPSALTDTDPSVAALIDAAPLNELGQSALLSVDGATNVANAKDAEPWQKRPKGAVPPPSAVGGTTMPFIRKFSVERRRGEANERKKEEELREYEAGDGGTVITTAEVPNEEDDDRLTSTPTSFDSSGHVVVYNDLPDSFHPPSAFGSGRGPPAFFDEESAAKPIKTLYAADGTDERSETDQIHGITTSLPRPFGSGRRPLASPFDDDSSVKPTKTASASFANGFGRGQHSHKSAEIRPKGFVSGRGPPAFSPFNEDSVSSTTSTTSDSISIATDATTPAAASSTDVETTSSHGELVGSTSSSLATSEASTGSTSSSTSHQFPTPSLIINGDTDPYPLDDPSDLASISAKNPRFDKPYAQQGESLSEMDVKTDRELAKLMRRTTVRMRDYPSEPTSASTTTTTSNPLGFAAQLAAASQAPSLLPGVLSGFHPHPPALHGTATANERSQARRQTLRADQFEQLGCGWDLFTQSCKDVFRFGWCGACADFGGGPFLHDCRCTAVTVLYVQAASLLASSARANAALLANGTTASAAGLPLPVALPLLPTLDQLGQPLLGSVTPNTATAVTGNQLFPSDAFRFPQSAPLLPSPASAPFAMPQRQPAAAVPLLISPPAQFQSANNLGSLFAAQRWRRR